MFLDNDFPKILGAELYRPHPAYVCEMAVEPVVVHDFTSQPGQTVQLDRYKFWGAPGTKDSRERIADQTIGCLLYTSPSPRDGLLSRMPSSA